MAAVCLYIALIQSPNCHPCGQGKILTSNLKTLTFRHVECFCSHYKIRILYRPGQLTVRSIAGICTHSLFNSPILSLPPFCQSSLTKKNALYSAWEGWPRKGKGNYCSSVSHLTTNGSPLRRRKGWTAVKKRGIRSSVSHCCWTHTFGCLHTPVPLTSTCIFT